MIEFDSRAYHQSLIPELPEGIPALEEVCHCCGEQPNYGDCQTCKGTSIKPSAFGKAILAMLDRRIRDKRFL